jgi:ligand-binding SRPBCC domain-containing protein
MPTFEHRSTIKDTTAEAVLAWHEHPNAFQRLTPPPVFIQVHRREMPSIRDGEVEFTMWMGPIPVRWMAQHAAGPIETSFIDRQIAGPLQNWEHTHLMQPVEGAVELIDRIQLEHPRGWRGIFTRLAFNGLALRGLFIYRHLRTRLGVRSKKSTQHA